MRLSGPVASILALAGLPSTLVQPPADTVSGAPFTFQGTLDTSATANKTDLTAIATMTWADPGFTTALGTVSQPEVYGLYDRIMVEVDEATNTPSVVAKLFSSLYLHHKHGNVTRAFSLAACAGSFLPDAATDTTTAGAAQLRRGRRARILKLPCPVLVDYASDEFQIRQGIAAAGGTLPIMVHLFGAAWKQSLAGAPAVESPSDAGAFIAALAGAKAGANLVRVARNRTADGIAAKLGR